MKVLSDILHKAGILKEAAEAYSSGGYSVLVRNSTTQRFETVASSAFVSNNIYTADGTLTGNRVVTLNDKQLVFRSNQSTLQNYTFTTGTPTGLTPSTWPSSVVFEGEYLMNANNPEPYNTRVWGRNQGGSQRSLWVNQVYADITAESTGDTRIFNQYYSTARGSVLDTSTTTTSVMRGVWNQIGHRYTGSQSTTTMINTNFQDGFLAQTINYIGNISNVTAFSASNSTGYVGTPYTTNITNYYGFYQSTGVIDSKSTITNHYGLFLATPFLNGGTITNRWGVYAPDAAMNHYINGNVVVGTSTLSGYKLDVNGFFRLGPSAGHYIGIDSNYIYKTLVSNTLYTQDSENIVMQANNTGYIAFATQIINRLVINNNGTVSVTSLAGTGSRMVVADSSGVLTTSALPTSTNIYNSDGTLTGNRTVSTTSGYTLTINPATTFTSNVYASYVNGNGGQLDLGSWGTTNLRFLNGLMSYDKAGTSFGYFGKFNINSANDGSAAMFIYSASLGQSGAISWMYNGGFSSSIRSSNLAEHDLTIQLRDGGKFHMFSNGNTTITSGTPTDAGYKLDVQGTGRFTSDILVNGITVGRGGGNVSSNTAFGEDTLLDATTGFGNAAFGFKSARFLTTGLFNAAFGLEALRSSTAGTGNSAFGYSCLWSSQGNRNTSVGSASFYSLSSGNDNTSLGNNSGRYISGGVTANTTSNNSIFIGSDTKALADNQTNQIVIGYNETGLGSNTTIIGNSSTVTTAIRGRLLLGTITDSGSYQLDVAGTGRFANTLSVITTGTTNEVALFKSTEPYITIEAAGGSNSASIFLKPSTSSQNATIQNRTGGGLEFYVDANYTTAKMTIKGTTVNISSLPTSATGLSSGDIWNDAGTLKVA